MLPCSLLLCILTSVYGAETSVRPEHVIMRGGDIFTTKLTQELITLLAESLKYPVNMQYVNY